MEYRPAPLAAARAGLMGVPLATLDVILVDQVSEPVVLADWLVGARTALRARFAAVQIKAARISRHLWRWLLMGVIVTSVVTLAVLVAPNIWYRLAAPETVPVATTESGTVFGGDFSQGPAAVAPQVSSYQPPVDASLPSGQWLVIPRIGVRTQLQQTATAEEALATGVWYAPGYGQPGSRDLPMILAAHRYGWQWWWQTDYWKYHSFYNLPQLEPGDVIEIIADQRKWVYEIYAGEEGDEITDYDADLILYTCKFLNSPVRHFRYARLVDPTQPTQQ